ncbi:SRPBCC domain-containing protein [Dactylosporangium maewongense]|uniref:SRPBCC domain-containing protein n=2 Tax=Dactylosporangium maewongense TaxID=634393 RepID=A0ABN2AZD8_9ACTN
MEADMTFPDRIERTLQLAHPPEKVWAALTTAEGLGTWFGNRAEVDLRVGGTARLIWDSGDTATLTITRVEPPHVFAYTWPIYGLPQEDPRRNQVEFTLTPSADGTTLTMIESGFAQVPDETVHNTAYTGNTKGWTSELGELVAYLDGQA